MSIDIEKLLQVATPVSEQTKAEVAFRKENKEWLRKSGKIALAIRRELRVQGMSQQDLAAKMALSPQYVGRILKGRENLTLDTISKLEAAVGKQLVTVGREERSSFSSLQTFLFCFPSIDAKQAWERSSRSYSNRNKQVIRES